MTQISYFWDGDSVGDATPMTANLLCRIFRLLFTKNDDQYVIRHTGYELQVIEDPNDSSKILVKPGTALVVGGYYRSTENVYFSPPLPETGTRYYHVVLRRDWSTQTIRLTLIGPKDSSPPSLYKNIGTVYEVEVASVSVTSAGIGVVVDYRSFCEFRSDMAP